MILTAGGQVGKGSFGVTGGVSMHNAEINKLEAEDR